MFSLVNGVYDNYLAPTKINLLILGPSGVGKTALLERLKVTQFPKRPSRQPSLSLAPLPRLLEETLVPEEDDDEEDTETKNNAQTTTTANDTEASTNNPEVETIEGENGDGNRPRMSTELSSSSVTTPRKTSLHRRSSSHSFSPTPSVVVTQAKRRGLAGLLCPAPERYRNSKEDQDEEFVSCDNSITSYVEKNDRNNSITQSNDPPRRLQRSRSKEFNVDDLTEIMGTPANTNGSSDHKSNSNVPQIVDSSERKKESATISSSLLQSQFEEVDKKSNAKMLPLEKIRPTIGTNLAKVDMYGAKVNLFDVGGKMKNMWDQYYHDCDGVVFCWKLGGDDPAVGSDSDDDDHDDKRETLDAARQQEILEQIRKSIPDDVPFLVFGHVFGNVNTELTNRIYGTNLLFPHYHNPMTGLCCGSAKTGAGFQSAMEWLIPLAKRQKKERLSRKSNLPKKL